MSAMRGWMTEVTAFHGTREKFRAFYFRPIDKALYSIGVWFTASPQVAAQFALTKQRGEHPRVIKVELRLQRPMVFDTYQELLTDCFHVHGDAKRYRRYLLRRGYDGIEIRKSTTDGFAERTDFVAFHRYQIDVISTEELPD